MPICSVYRTSCRWLLPVPVYCCGDLFCSFMLFTFAYTGTTTDMHAYWIAVVYWATRLRSARPELFVLSVQWQRWPRWIRVYENLKLVLILFLASSFWCQSRSCPCTSGTCRCRSVFWPISSRLEKRILIYYILKNSYLFLLNANLIYCTCRVGQLSVHTYRVGH